MNLSCPIFKLQSLSFSILILAMISHSVNAQQSVSIGDTQIKTNAVLYLKGNGTQGLIIPVTADHNSVPKAAGMIVFNSADSKVYACNGTTWTALSGGSSGTANYTLTLSGNSLVLKDGTTTVSTVALSSSTPAANQFLMWDGSKWAAVSMSQDVTNANGVVTVTGIKAKAIPAFPVSGVQALIYDATSSSWKFQTLTTGGTVTQITAGTGLTGGAITTTGTINVDVGTGANKIVQLDGTGKLPAVDGSQLTNLPASATSLNGLSDAIIASPALGQVLVNDGAGQFKNVSLSGDVTGVTAAGAVTIAPITSAKITDGTITTIDLANSSVTGAKLANTTVAAATYGSATQVPQFTVDAQGRLTSASNVSIAAAATDLNGLSDATVASPALGQVLVNDGAGQFKNVALSGDITGVTATGAVTIASITSAKITDGTIAAADLATSSVTTTQITDGTIATVDLANSSVTGAKLANTTVTAAIYGSATQVPQFTVDAQGRLTSASNVAIAAAATDLNGLSDATIASPALGQVLVNDGAGQFKNVALSGDVTGVTAAGAVTIAPITSAKITDGTIAAADLATSSVTTTQITDGTIATVDLANSSVTGAKLANTTVTAAIYGSATQVPQFTVDAQGRITAASNVTITAGATDLNGLSDATIASPALGQVLVNDGAGQFKNVALSGDVTGVTAAGAVTIAPITSAKITDGTITSADLATSSVTATQITDGSIMNADINASAAIAGIKITPNFGTQDITTTGKTVLNTISYAWPGTQGAANTFLKNDGTGIISWSTVPASFSTNNFIPKGDGTTLIASQIFANGTGVGINTTSPSTELQIEGNTPTLRIRSTQSTTLSQSFVEFGHDNGSGGFTSTGSIGDVGSNDGLQLFSPFTINFNVNFADRFSMGSLGQFGIASDFGTAGQVFTSGGPGAAASWTTVSGSTLISNPGTNNLFAGVGAGANNTTGSLNTFVGAGAGGANTSAKENTFIGRNAGAANTIGQFNVFVGKDAGQVMVNGGLNTFVGYAAGNSATTGDGSTFLGRAAGNATTSGEKNTFLGERSAEANTTGSENTMVGRVSGASNLTGTKNTLVGSTANVGSGALTNATALGYGAVVNTSNSLVLGNGSVNVGIGTSSPTSTLDVVGDIKVNDAAGEINSIKSLNTGGANMIPVAYGNISSTGAINNGTGNFTASKTATGIYHITWSSGESLSLFSGASVNLSCTSGNARILAWSSTGGGTVLIVKVYDATGTAIDDGFSFVVFNP